METAEPQLRASLVHGQSKASMIVQQEGDLRSYDLTSNAPLRDNRPADKRVVFSEATGRAVVRSGNPMFDGLYAMAVHEAVENSVPEIKDYAYNHGKAFRLNAFETGEKWNYVWTRDLAYSVHLSLASFDPKRAVSSLLFKTSTLKPSVAGGYPNQIIQDTGSGGSYPVSTDRASWALGAWETLKHLDGAERESFLKKVYPILRDTIEQDRILVYDPADGLYRGEQSFLDWREQTYPGWTKDNVLPIAMSKALSVNTLHYYLLSVASECAVQMNEREEAACYAGWAEKLKTAINEHFYDSDAGLYCTYLLSDGLSTVRVNRYDLLGESLAILFGVADAEQAKSIIEKYPVGPHGPPVVWPQERTVPIYHNQGIWPFVTTYWVKAARKAGNAEAVNNGVRSLEHLAAVNLSNMENYDFTSSLAHVENKALNGPVINSRRQLWSVAGYLSMVQDVIFGLETSWEGIRFQPTITAQLRSEMFGFSEIVELRNFAYRNTRNNVRIHLPPVDSKGRGVCAIQEVKLNGKTVGNTFIAADALSLENQWDITLQAPEPDQEMGSLRIVNPSDERMLFGPVQPTWSGGITAEEGRWVLHYRHADPANVSFNIYRDGQRVAKGVRQTTWADEISANDSAVAHCYAVEAVDLKSGNTSHLTPFLSYSAEGQKHVIPAREMQNRGGSLVSNHHFENWGRSADELTAKSFEVGRSGRYAVRAEFSNGSGPVNTGITCAVKKLDVLEFGSNAVVATGYLVMPQSGNWSRWELSNPVSVQLDAGKKYTLRVREDGYSRNMSYLKHNDRYTAWPGGGDSGYNYVNISAIHIEQISSTGSGQSAHMAGGDVAVFYPPQFDPAGTQPSVIFEHELVDNGVVPSSWAVTPSFSTVDGKAVATIAFDGDVDLYGNGEVMGPLRRNGTEVELWNTDNYGYYKHQGKRLYQSHPWVMGVRADGSAFGIIADNTWKQSFKLSNSITITSEGPSFRVIVIEKKNPIELQKALAELTGKMALPPLWALGFQQCRHSYFPDSQVKEIADEFRARKIPCDVIWMDINYMDHYKIFTFDKTGFSNPKQLNKTLHEQDFKTVYMIDPGVKKEAGYFVYDQGGEGNHWVQTSSGQEFNGDVWPGACAFPDFTRPETRAWWGELYKDFMTLGIDGIWNDMNEPAVFNVPTDTMPEECLHRGGGGLPAGSHLRYHNIYGMLMVKASREGIMKANPDKRPFVLSRSNFLGGQRYAAMWTGDNQSSWEHLKLSIPMSLNIGLSGQPFNGPDIGGFVGDCNGELLGHWMALGAYYPFSRNHNSIDTISQEPWAFGDKIEDVSRTAINRRYRLMPYLYTLFREASQSGMPVMRPVFFADLLDQDLRDEQQTFLLGGDLMIVPRWASGIDFPEGDWDRIKFEKDDDGYQPIVLLRPGAIVPVGPVVQSTEDYTTEQTTLLINPAADGSASGTLYHDAGNGYGYQTGDYAIHQFTCSRTDEDTLEIEISRVEGKMAVNRLYRIGYVTDGDVIYSEWATNLVRNVSVIPDQTLSVDYKLFSSN